MAEVRAASEVATASAEIYPSPKSGDIYGAWLHHDGAVDDVASDLILGAALEHSLALGN